MLWKRVVELQLSPPVPFIETGAVLVSDIKGAKHKDISPEELERLCAHHRDAARKALYGTGGIEKGFEGDSIRFWFPGTNATDCVQGAIHLQEAYQVELEPLGLICAVGVAWGQVAFVDNEPQGPVPAFAKALTHAAAGKGILLHASAAEVTDFAALASKRGAAANRQGTSYQGPLVHFSGVRGVRDPVPCLEVLWADELFGPSNSVSLAEL